MDRVLHRDTLANPYLSLWFFLSLSLSDSLQFNLRRDEAGVNGVERRKVRRREVKEVKVK